MADPKEDEQETEAQDAAERRKARRAARAKAREEARAKEAEETEEEGSEEGDEDAEETEEAEGGEEEGSEDAEAAPQETAKPNRRERRRRKKLGDAEAAPKDRNAKIRAQHKARKRSESDEEALTPLSTSEMLDDAVARGTARAGKWVRVNAGLLQVVLVLLILGGAGYGIYTWQTSSKAESASSELMTAVNADRARVDPAGAKPGNDEEEILPVFKTAGERNTAALTGYRKARSARSDSGTALLARLGEAGVLLDQHSYDEALAAYREVKGSQLAAADPDVRGRCIEGIGFALEGKGDIDGAIKAFKELDTVTGIKIYKELGMYHQARLLATKGEKELPLKLIKEARERLQTTGEARNASYLVGVLDELQRKVDPSSMPKRALGGAGRQPSLEELQKIQQQVLKEIEKGNNSGHQDEH